LTGAHGDSLRRPTLIGWLSFAGALLLCSWGVLSVFFASAPADVFPVGDEAMLEIYTMHASHGIWAHGPYSQFAWNHPGPLYFYLLAPFYLLSGEKTIALHVGAFAINLVSLLAIVVVLIRYATPAVTCAGVLGIGVYLFRLEPLISSYWNPHIVVLPVAAFLVVCAALAAGHVALLPAVAVLGSFLAQTHVSLVPYVVALAGGALLSAVVHTASSEHEATSAAAAAGAHRRSLGVWISVFACCLLLLWLIPIADELGHHPGNLTRLLRFFGEPADSQPLRRAFSVWADTVCAVFRAHLDIPVGARLKLGEIGVARVGAVAQVLLLLAAWWDARRRRERFDAALCAVGVLASAIAVWSITRIRTLIGDYMVFWVSVIGAVNFAVIAGVGLTRLVSVRLRDPLRWAAVAASALVVMTYVYLGVNQLGRTRRYEGRPPRESAQTVKVVSDAIIDDLRRHDVQRPLFRFSTPAWGEAAGVLLQLYKRGVAPAVEQKFVNLFGEPLAPDGHADRVYVFADASLHAALTQRPGDEVVAAVDDLYVHAMPVAQSPE
jgi:hypothetical protein